MCPVHRETNAVPFLTDKQMHTTLTRTLTQTRCMLQNNTFVFILRFFLGFALPAGGLFSRAGRGSRCCRRPSAGCCSACSCTSSVRLVSLGRLLLALLHKHDQRAKECKLLLSVVYLVFTFAFYFFYILTSITSFCFLLFLLHCDLCMLFKNM